jgi:hypothetical protein
MESRISLLNFEKCVKFLILQVSKVVLLFEIWVKDFNEFGVIFLIENSTKLYKKLAGFGRRNKLSGELTLHTCSNHIGHTRLVGHWNHIEESVTKSWMFFFVC